MITRVATYLPAWSSGSARTLGPDEDVITEAVAAGIAALDGASAQRVVLVTRDMPMLEGSSTGPLIAALGLPDSTPASVVLGGAPAILDALVSSQPGTLVIGADALSSPGAGAALIGDNGLQVELIARSDRSLPLWVRSSSGAVSDYDDARLGRERAVKAGIARLGLSEPAGAVVGIAAALGGTKGIATMGASAPFFALADGAVGSLVAVEEATVVAVRVGGGELSVSRHEPEPQPLPQRRMTADANIAISLPAYERAFDAKLRLQAGRCDSCGELALPPRHRCLGCGSEAEHPLVPLPRSGVVYTVVTIRTPVPGLQVPYSLAIIELGGSGVRQLVTVTDCEPGSVGIGDTGDMVLRRVAVRAGVPDYGYAFAPRTKQGVAA